MKKLGALFLVVSLLAALLSGCAQSAAPASSAPAENTTPAADTPKDKIEIKFGHANSVDQAANIYSQMWADRVSELSGGRITITVYPASQLGSLDEMAEAVTLGTLDACMGDTSFLSNFLPELGVLSLPFLIKDYDMGEEIYDGEITADLWNKLATEHSTHVLAWWWNGFRIIGSRTPITSVADCKGIKIRTAQVPVFIETFSRLGMKPTPMPWGDTYTAYQSGIVDAMETPAEVMCTQEFDKIGGNICNSRHMLNVIGPTMNEQFWQSLSAEDQDILMTAVKEVTEKQRANAIEQEAGYLKTMADRGANVTEFSDSQELVELYKPYWTEYAGQAGAEDLLDKIIALS